MNWSLQDAKNSFSKVVKLAKADGPQIVTIRGERAAVIIAADEYDKLVANRPTLVEYLLSAPRIDDETFEAINARSKDPEDRDLF